MRILVILAFMAQLLMAAEPSAAVRTILESKDFHQRLDAVHSLNDNLSQTDRQALYDLLVRPEGYRGEAVLENDLLNVLRRSNDPRLDKVLLHMARDPQQDSVIRDYALQHLGLWYPMARNKPEIRETLWQATDLTGNSMAGTALLALLRQAPVDPEIDRSRLGRRALEIASDRSAGELSRITALRICGQLNKTEALEPALGLVHGDASISLQLAAIATIGDLGDDRQTELLQKLANSGSKRLAHAAAIALDKLKDKRTGAGS